MFKYIQKKVNTLHPIIKRKLKRLVKTLLVFLVIFSLLSPYPYQIYNSLSQAAQRNQQRVQLSKEKQEERNKAVVKKLPGNPNDTLPETVKPLGEILALSTPGIRFDDKSNSITIEKPVGEIKKVTFNNLDLPTQTEDVFGKKAEYEYDDYGNLTKATDKNGITRQYIYDDNGNLLRSYIVNPDKLSYIQSLPWYKKIFASFFANFIAWAAEDTEKIELSYTEDGDITEVADNNSKLTYNYDENGNVTGVIDSNSTSVNYEYDEFGNVIGKRQSEKAQNTDSKPQNPLSRLLRKILIVYADTNTQTQQSSYSYDIAGKTATTEISIPLDATDESLTETPEATPSSTLTPQPSPVANPDSSPSASPQPDPSASPSPTPSVQSSLFNKILSLFSGRAIAATTQKVRTLSISKSRDELGNLIESQDSNGLTTTYLFTENDQPKGVKVVNLPGETITNIEYEFDDNLRYIKRTEENYPTQTYEYDGLGQLVKTTDQQVQNASYAYDEKGNRTEKQDGEGTTKYEYQANRLTKQILPNGDTLDYTYDNNGNLIEKKDRSGVTAYSYTTENYLEKITLANGKTISYSLDPVKRRISKTVDNKTIYYTYEGNNLTTVKDENNTILKQYLYDADNSLIGVVKDGISYTFIKDTHNSIVSIVDQENQIVDHFSYDAWGRLTSTPKTDLTDFYYSSYFLDQDTQLYLLGPRAYDPTIGRFYSQDPIPGDLDNILTQNEYIYSLNDPVNNIDPTGHWPFKFNIGASIKAVVDAAKRAAEDINRRAREAAEAARRAIEEAKRRAEAVARQVAEEIARKAEAARQALEAANRRAQELVRQQQEELRRQQEEARKRDELKRAEEARRQAEQAQRIREEQERKLKELEAQKKREDQARIQQEEERRKQEAKRAEELKNAISQATKQAEEAARKVAEVARKAVDEGKKAADVLAKKIVEQQKQLANAKKLEEAKAKIAKAKQLADQKKKAAETKRQAAVEKQKQAQNLINSFISVGDIQKDLIRTNSKSSGRTGLNASSITQQIKTTLPPKPAPKVVKNNSSPLATKPVPVPTQPKVQNAPDGLPVYAFSFGAGFVPGVGETYDITSALTGKDVITNEDLSLGERLLSGVLVVVPGVSGSQARAVFKGGKVVKIEFIGLGAKQTRRIFNTGWLNIKKALKSGGEKITSSSKGDDVAKIGNKAEDVITFLKSSKNPQASRKVVEEMVEKVKNDKLRNIINNLYRPGAQVGGGSSADYIRQINDPGHIEKGKNYLKGLNDVMSQKLSEYDKKIAEFLKSDLENALLGK